VLNAMHDHLNGGTAPDAKTPHAELRAFVTEVVPDLDQERVYHSDLKKLCTWYNALVELSLLPFSADETEEVAEEAETAEAEAEEAVSEDAVEEEADGEEA
ncbi:MAG: hypothetical protein ACPF8Y_10395, partial [Flavobacteriales bacterium]